MGSGIVAWVPVAPLGPTNGSIGPLLETVDTLRQSWVAFLETVSEQDFMEARQRSLRRHAVETGIIERLYDVSWGVTYALVAEGLTREVAEREGGIEEHALEAIQAQFDALGLLALQARSAEPLTLFFVRQLHQLITSHQLTYEGRDASGRHVDAVLRHGAWKKTNNHVERQDGSILQYTPHEHVESEMERLLQLFKESIDEHPLVRAAWLHHRFIRIHPFEDGNGRVGRALVLLVLLSANYAPLVVRRDDREAYIAALDEANSGDISGLIRLFARLEIVALRSELALPTPAAAVGESPGAVAQAVAERLRAVQLNTEEARSQATASLASDAWKRIQEELQNQARQIEAAFKNVDAACRATVDAGGPGDDRSHWWRNQIIRTANEADFFTNLSSGAWWVSLRLTVLAQRLRFVVVVQKVGHGETGVLAMTVFAESAPLDVSSDEERLIPTPLIVTTPADSVTLNQSDSIEERWVEMCDVIERTLAEAVAEFGGSLG
jgi:fido (protein-threonine AMPylation protein)